MTLSTVQAWKAGKAPARWNGARAEGSRLLVSAGYQVGIEHAKIEQLADYRRLFHLCTMQTDLIEHLMIEHNFYRDNCHRQACFGLMVNSLFG